MCKANLQAKNLREAQGLWTVLAGLLPVICPSGNWSVFKLGVHRVQFTNVNLLEELAKPEFSELLSAFSEKFFPKQSVIFEPTYDDDLKTCVLQLSEAAQELPPCVEQTKIKPDNYVFIVRTGRIRVYLSYANKEFTIAVLRPGDVYVSHSNAFVQALEDSRILLIDTPTFNKRMMSLPQFAASVVRVLGGILKNTFSIIDGLALRDASVRLARYLIATARQNTAGKGLIQLDLSGELLAQRLGASRQTISTLLNDLTRSGILHKERRGVYRILDEDRLCELVV